MYSTSTILRSALLVALAGVVGFGCSTSMTNLSSARTVDPGEHQTTVGGQVNLNSAIIVESREAYQDVRASVEERPEDEQLSESTFRNVLDAALVTALFLPSPTAEGAYRVGISNKPLEGIDAGLRFNGRTLKFDTKLQFWESAEGAWAGSVQLGYGHQFSAAPSTASKLSLQEWSRHDIDLMVPFGTSGQIGRFYVAPRLIWSKISVSPNFDSDLRKRIPPPLKNEVDSWFSDEHLLYAGANVGGMIGYKYVFLALELNVMYVAFTPEVLGETRDLSGVTVAPAGGLVVQF